MAVGDNVAVNPGTGAAITADAVNRGEGTSYSQMVKILDATDGSINPLVVDSSGAARVADVGLRTSGVTKLLALPPRNAALTDTDIGTWTLAAAGAANLANRLDLLIFNDSDVRIRAAFATTTALQDGIPIPSGQTMYFHGNINVYIQPELGGAAGNKNAIVLEGA